MGRGGQVSTLPHTHEPPQRSGIPHFFGTAMASMVDPGVDAWTGKRMSTVVVQVGEVGVAHARDGRPKAPCHT